MALARRSYFFFFKFLFSSQTVNKTLSPSLLAHGCELGCSEQVVITLSAVTSKTEHRFLYDNDNVNDNDNYDDNDDD